MVMGCLHGAAGRGRVYQMLRTVVLLVLLTALTPGTPVLVLGHDAGQVLVDGADPLMLRCRTARSIAKGHTTQGTRQPGHVHRLLLRGHDPATHLLVLVVVLLRHDGASTNTPGTAAVEQMCVGSGSQGHGRSQILCPSVLRWSRVLKARGSIDRWSVAKH